MKLKKSVKIYILLILVIILLIFYIVKVGGIEVNEKNNVTSTTKKTENTEPTSSTRTINTTEKISTTKTTTAKTTTAINTTKSLMDNENINQNLKIIDGVLIVNKTYPLPKDYVPTNTYKSAEGLNYCSTCINNDAYNQYKLMKADATSLGLNIWIQSGYRSYSLQNDLYNKYVNRDGKEAADTYSARPGHSEHQTGLAFDLNTITDDFQYTNEGIWVNENCYKYGFILRYPNNKTYITGYKYEPWHWRYVGIDVATKIYEEDITFEEYVVKYQ